MRPLVRLDVATHLGLYTAFHRTSANRLTHAIAVPIVLVSLMCVQAYAVIPGAGPLAHVGTGLTIALTLVIASVDALGALLLLALLLPCCVATAWLAALPFALVAPIALTVHGLAWYATVVVGHEHLEGAVELSTGFEDSNLYFRRGHYRGLALGAPLGLLDPMLQFCIAPLAVVQDVLVVLGARHGLERTIEERRDRVLANLAAGRPPLEGCDAIATPRRSLARGR